MSGIVLLEVVFWGCVAAIAATYLVYPLSLRLPALVRRRHTIGDETPFVTLVISAYNESAVIGEKLDNALALDYPADRLEVLVISDASDDGTDAIVAEYADRGVVLRRQEPRGGKSLGLTKFVPRARGEILVFSDANSLYAPDALRKLVRHLQDPTVGFVAGHQRYLAAEGAAGASESLYWRYETWVKRLESRAGSVVGGDGAIMAIRAGLFEPLREDDINDFLLPLRIVARGYRGVFDPEAVCYGRTADSFRGEFRRKVRIVNRSFRALFRVPQVLNPFRVGVFAFQVLFHKLLRWFVPFFLLALAAAHVGLAIADDGLFRWALPVHAAFYGLAALHAVPFARRWRLVYVPYYFCVVNAAAGLGILTCLLGLRFSTWKPEREPTAMSPAEASGS
jgi:cellulose synthase/poly-beta-1,6-N-acetylglucosamine synthase-like glycosyltransferase